MMLGDPLMSVLARLGAAEGQQAPLMRDVQPFSQKSLTATVPKVFQIGLCGVVEADLELFRKSWSGGFLGCM